MKRLLLLILFALFVIPLGAQDRLSFSVDKFAAGETFIRFGKGTEHGLVSDFMGPKATKGVLKDIFGNEAGTFTALFATDFETIARVDSRVEGIPIEDIDHLAIDHLDLSYVKFHWEDSHDYFYLDKGIKDIDPKKLKRGAKGNLYDDQGKLAGICTIETATDNRSLGRVTQFNAN